MEANSHSMPCGTCSAGCKKIVSKTQYKDYTESNQWIFCSKFALANKLSSSKKSASANSVPNSKAKVGTGVSIKHIFQYLSSSRSAFQMREQE